MKIVSVAYLTLVVLSVSFTLHRGSGVRDLSPLGTWMEATNKTGGRYEASYGWYNLVSMFHVLSSPSCVSWTGVVLIYLVLSLLFSRYWQRIWKGIGLVGH